jgi:hypothetical protein
MAAEPLFPPVSLSPLLQVVALLEKLPPQSIMLDPTMLGKVDRDQRERQKEMAAEKVRGRERGVWRQGWGRGARL